MASIKQKNSMAEYLSNCLEASGNSVKDYEIAINNGNLPVRYLRLNENKEDSIFLIADSKAYNEKNTKELFRTIKASGIENPGFVFYKDGKHFFRCPESNENKLSSLRHKLHPDRSLKNYIDRSPSEFIEPTKAERMIREKNANKILQYYQPKSERLEEMLVSFDFEIPILDYTHKRPEELFGPVKKPSERYFLTRKRINTPGSLDLNSEVDGLIRPFYDGKKPISFS